MRRADNAVVSIKGTYVRETELAFQFIAEEVSGKPLPKPCSVWIPFSCLTRSVRDKNHVKEDIAVISEWIAKQKGLI